MTYVLGVVLTYTVTGLTNGFNYTFNISAYNSVGEGPQSTMVWAVPQLFVPNQPTSPAAVASPSTVSLSWNIPNFDGGTPLIGYTIYRGTATGTETYYTTILNVTSFIDTPVANGTTYYYLIAANNTVGIGANSF